MSLVQLYIPSEVAHDTISELAELGNFQFKDVSYLLFHLGWQLTGS
jgi:V-type H+-transporting ATPase subunit a